MSMVEGFRKYYSVFLCYLPSKVASESGYINTCSSVEFLALCERYEINNRKTFDELFSVMDMTYVTERNNATTAKYERDRKAMKK